MAKRSEMRITVVEYERMIEEGLLRARNRVGLQEGKIVELSPIGSPSARPPEGRGRHPRAGEVPPTLELSGSSLPKDLPRGPAPAPAALPTRAPSVDAIFEPL